MKPTDSVDQGMEPTTLFGGLMQLCTNFNAERPFQSNPTLNPTPIASQQSIPTSESV